MIQKNEDSTEEVGGELSQDSAEQSALVFLSFNEACEWSRANAGRAFNRCANGVAFQPVSESEASQATQSWHSFEELYIDGPYRNEMS